MIIFRYMKALRTIISLVLTATVLLASNGVVLAVHTCFTAKTTAVSLFHHGACKSEKKQASKRKADCCSRKKNKSSGDHVSSSCCVETISYKKSELSGTVDVTGPVLMPTVTSVIATTTVPEINASVSTNDFLNKPPPLCCAAHPDFIFAIGTLLI